MKAREMRAHRNYGLKAEAIIRKNKRVNIEKLGKLSYYETCRIYG